MEFFAALDPGRDKCGFAIFSDTGLVMHQMIVPTGRLMQEVKRARSKYNIKKLIIGDGTTSQEARNKLQRAFSHLELVIVDEYNTTQLAKKEYWKAHPPTGWRRLIPLGMQSPPVPVDDYVAVLLGKRYLGEGE